MNANQRRLNLLSEKIIGCAYTVQNILGKGFVEKVYANALAFELSENHVLTRSEFPIKVYYKGLVIGDFVGDILVEDSILVETKACVSINNIHRCQCINYLKATHLSLCLLINFGSPKVEVARIVNNF